MQRTPKNTKPLLSLRDLWFWRTLHNNIIAAGCSVGEKVHVNAFHEAFGDCVAACADGVSPFVNDD